MMNHKYNFKLTAVPVGPNGHDAPVLQLVRVGLSWADSIEVTFNWVNTSSIILHFSHYGNPVEPEINFKLL